MEVAPSSSLITSKYGKSKQEEDEDLLTDVREDLAELFLWWYGKDVALKVLKQSFNRKGRMILCTDTTEANIPLDEDIAVGLTEDCWQNKWFPVDQQHEKKVDDFIAQRFGSLLDHDTPKYECVTNLQPGCLWEALSLIVLFDQASRCVYRGDPKAYLTDHKATHYALELVKSGTVEKLPLHFESTVLIALCHSEDPSVQEVVGHIIRSKEFDQYLVSHERIANALKLIHRDNVEKVDLFGRFPDRNKILNRQSTPEEEIYMASVVDREADMKDMAESK